MATAEIDLGRLNLGSTDRLRFTMSKDGAPWSGIDSVELVMVRVGSATRLTRSMTLDDDALGRWAYDTAVDDFDAAGNWTLNVRVTDGPIVKRYPYPITLYVADEP